MYAIAAKNPNLMPYTSTIQYTQRSTFR